MTTIGSSLAFVISFAVFLSFYVLRTQSKTKKVAQLICIYSHYDEE